jgi:hypothetical protein
MTTPVPVPPPEVVAVTVQLGMAMVSLISVTEASSDITLPHAIVSPFVRVSFKFAPVVIKVPRAVLGEPVKVTSWDTQVMLPVYAPGAPALTISIVDPPLIVSAEPI